MIGFSALCIVRLFADKQNAQRISAAMCGNGTACTGHQHLIKYAHIGNLLYALINDGCVAACVGDEDALGIDVRSIANAICNVLFQRHGKFAAIFLTNDHFAVADHDTRLELQQVSAKRCNCRATATLMEKFEVVDVRARRFSMKSKTSSLVMMQLPLGGF